MSRSQPRRKQLRTIRDGPQGVSATHHRPRTHDFTGCVTCRERHVKCDLGQPLCNNCLRLNIPCEGYVRKYSWLPSRTVFGGKSSRKSTRQNPKLEEPVEDVEENQSSRRVLFSGSLRSKPKRLPKPGG